MSDPIGEQLRRMVEARAHGLCEYCLIHQDDTFFGCEVEHIISQKHGGPSEVTNLAYACLPCNRHKGSDLGSIHRATGNLVRFFHPRRDRWADHFRLDEGRIVPKTEIGEVTVRILRLNDPDRVLERETLIALGRYPIPRASAGR